MTSTAHLLQSLQPSISRLKFMDWFICDVPVTSGVHSDVFTCSVCCLKRRNTGPLKNEEKKAWCFEVGFSNAVTGLIETRIHWKLCCYGP